MRAFLEEIAIKAGDELLRHFRKLQGYEVKADQKGFVTAADLASEKLVKELISAKYPHDTILAEESGLSEGTFDPRLPMEARLMWYIDPLDGTNNFAHGNPYYCVSIAYGDETGGIYSAAVYQPFTKLMFSADKGEGAYCNGERIKLSSEPKKFEEGAYSTGWASSKGRELDEIGENVMRVQKACTSTAVRMNGAAALDMAFTAWSVFDGFWERNLNPWDTAAGSLIIEEAGGVVLNEKGERFNCRRDLFVVAGHPSIVAKLLKLVARPKS